MDLHNHTSVLVFVVREQYGQRKTKEPLWDNIGAWWDERMCCRGLVDAVLEPT